MADKKDVKVAPDVVDEPVQPEDVLNEHSSEDEEQTGPAFCFSSDQCVSYPKYIESDRRLISSISSMFLSLA